MCPLCTRCSLALEGNARAGRGLEGPLQATAALAAALALASGVRATSRPAPHARTAVADEEQLDEMVIVLSVA